MARPLSQTPRNLPGEGPVTRTQLFLTLGVVVLLLLAAGGYYYLVTNSDSDMGASAGPGFVVTKTDHTLGNPKAPVVLIEYGAPSCPVCAAFNRGTFPELKQNYIDTGKVFYVFRVFPIREDDGTAEKIALCVPADKYLAFIDLLFRNQSKWDVEFNQGFNEKDVHDALVQQGRIAGLSAEKVDQCINNKAEDQHINDVAKDGEAKYNISGTPTFVVNGENQGTGDISYPDLKKILDTAAAGK
jgi:protein-disulfide isomerase